MCPSRDRPGQAFLNLVLLPHLGVGANRPLQ